ncbi:HI1506-related protein [Pseudomonas sp. GD04158]|uniref:HI1506-related protein n=1 Tax=Pseudomonas sp. GD04158 TaxID=2975439 RepID=UPI00244A36C6|nr:HI1506-related protein [Pseudomonas sp. GD04158]MDH0095861.1 HI1506-related protein [Pseudomonas sp. GD04158]
MAGTKSTTKAPAKAPAKSAEKAAPATAPAAAEQLATQPAAPTDNAAPAQVNEPASTEQPTESVPAQAGDMAGNGSGVTTGQEAHPVVILGGEDIREYLYKLKAAGENLGDLIPLSQLDEPLLRQVGQFVEIEGFADLPPEHLAMQIEAKVGIGASVTPAPVPYPPGVDVGVDPLAVALSELKPDAVVTQPGAEAQAATSPAGGSATDAVDGLGDDGDYEGLWIEAIPEQGFRRCGFRFTREGFGIAIAALTVEQIEQLENEPNLKVERGIFSGRVGERVY